MSSRFVVPRLAARTLLGKDADRAVSTLVATVLLVAIVVVVSGGIAVTVTGVANGQLNVTREVLSQLVDAMRVTCADAGLTCTFE